MRFSSLEILFYFRTGHCRYARDKRLHRKFVIVVDFLFFVIKMDIPVHSSHRFDTFLQLEHTLEKSKPTI